MEQMYPNTVELFFTNALYVLYAFFQVNGLNISVQSNLQFYNKLAENLMDLNENVIQLSGIQKDLWRMVAAAEFILRAAMSTGTTASLTRTFFFECDYSKEDYIWYDLASFRFHFFQFRSLFAFERENVIDTSNLQTNILDTFSPCLSFCCSAPPKGVLL